MLLTQARVVVAVVPQAVRLGLKNQALAEVEEAHLVPLYQALEAVVEEVLTARYLLALVEEVADQIQWMQKPEQNPEPGWQACCPWRKEVSVAPSCRRGSTQVVLRTPQQEAHPRHWSCRCPTQLRTIHPLLGDDETVPQ